MISYPEPFRTRGPKQFVSVPLDIGMREALGTAATGLNYIASAESGGKFWHFDSKKTPHPSNPSVLYFTAHSNYPMAAQKGIIQLGCVATDVGDEGTVLTLNFSDNWGWSLGGSESIIGESMLQVHNALRFKVTPWPTGSIWRLTEGGWTYGCTFDG